MQYSLDNIHIKGKKQRTHFEKNMKKIIIYDAIFFYNIDIFLKKFLSFNFLFVELHGFLNTFALLYV